MIFWIFCLHLSHTVYICPLFIPQIYLDCPLMPTGFSMTQYTLSHVPCLFLSSVPYKLSHITHTECIVRPELYDWHVNSRIRVDCYCRLSESYAAVAKERQKFAKISSSGAFVQPSQFHLGVSNMKPQTFFCLLKSVRWCNKMPPWE